MGNYINIEDISLRDSLLIHLSGGDTAPDDDVINERITRAEDVVNGYISAKYEVPLEKAYKTGMVKMLCSTISIYFLYLYSDQSVPDDHKDNYNAAIKTLENVNIGKIKLGADSTDEATAVTSLTSAIARS